MPHPGSGVPCPAMANPFRFSLTATGTTDPTEFRELARRAEDLGYSTLSIADHLDHQLAPIVALSVAAEATSTLRILSLVLANDYRHPVMLAKEAAALDLFSDGRLELGIGAGWMASDYQQAGLPYNRPGVRIARLAEAVSILKASFGEDPVNFNGDHYRVDGFVNSPGPVQQPGPPLMIAGGGRKVLSLAASEADIVGVNVSLSAGVIDARAGATAGPAATSEKIGWIREAAGDRFAQLEIQTRVHLATITNDRLGIASAMAPALGMTPEDALATPHALIGTETECIETLQRWRDDWGITYIGFSSDAINQMAPVVAALAP
jgi:probable F420-dependent oxidoreductase